MKGKHTAMFLSILLVSIAIPASASAFLLELGLGVKGGVNGNVVNGVPENQTIQFEGQTYQVDPDMYAMFGVGGAIGAVVELRAIDIIGLETGFHLSFDNGDGWEDQKSNGVNLGRVDQEQRTTAFHIPVLAKAVVPGFVRPAFGLGVEIVVQSDSTLSYSSDEFDVSGLEARNDIQTSTYVNLLATIGMEIDLKMVRIPIEVRLGYNPQFFDNRLKERVEVESISPPRFVYDGQYQGYFGIFTGVVYDFDFVL